MLEVDIRKDYPAFTLSARFTGEQGILVLFGPSGAGKSLTLRCIAGIARPDSGRIAIDGLDVFDSARGLDTPPQRRRVGYVPQNYALFPHLTVERNVAYGLIGVPGGEARRRVGEMLALMRLEGLEGRYPAELSGGQQQRVALARALVIQPKLLLLDEPFSALDYATRQELWLELKRIQHEFQITTVHVTHSLEEAFVLSDCVGIVYEGEVRQFGPPEEMFRRPESRALAYFMGVRNVLDGIVVSTAGDGVVVDWRGHQIELPPDPELKAGQRVIFCIRPADVHVVRPDRPVRDTGEGSLLMGIVADEMRRGVAHDLFVRLDGSDSGHDLEVSLPDPLYRRFQMGRNRRITLQLLKASIHVIKE
ncbi:MAG: ABC transporter ATP-binding protein [Chloroflexi bacterium]|nr:ABC transporter ATP-binding protein [Chloroflexota bacterium]